MVGTTDGALILVDVTTPEQPRPVLKRLLHKGRVTALGFVFILLSCISILSFYYRLMISSLNLSIALDGRIEW